MEIKIEPEKIKKFFIWENLKKNSLKFFLDKSRIIFFLIAISLSVYCVYIWYDLIYSGKWDEAKKEEYMTTKEKETVFNKSGFEKSIEEFEWRKAKAEKENEEIQDIFRLNNVEAEGAEIE